MTLSRTTAWSVWLIASIFYAYQYVLRVLPNILMDDIMNHFHIDATVFGQFSGVYYLGYSLVHLPIGVALDRYGPKKVMPFCILLTVVGSLPLIYADNWIYPVMGRALIGVGSSAAILGTLKIVRLTFKEQHFARMLSLSVTIGLIGAIYGGGPVNYMCDTLGETVVIHVLMGVGVVLALIAYGLMPEETESIPKTFWADIRLALSNTKVLILCFSAGLMVGPLEGFADVWAAEFLKQVYHLDLDIAGYLSSMIFVGMCFGAPILSLIAEKTKAYTITIVGAGLVMCVGFLALLSGLLTIPMMTALFLVIGVCCSYQILALYKASTYGPGRVAGLTTAVTNMIIMSFGYGFHSVIGLVVNTYGGITNPTSFLYGISVIPLTLGLGSLGFIYLALQDHRVERT